MAKLAARLLAYRAATCLERASKVVSQPSLVVTRQGQRVSLDINRPRFFNCIDDTVINPLAAQLSRLLQDPELELLLIGSINPSSKGKKARGVSFSTGADLIKGWRIIDRRQKEGRIDLADRLYLVNFYRAQQLLYTLSRQSTTVALMDGITMGSAVLFGFNSTFSLVTERTTWAAPEVSIGSVPDVGSIYHLNKLGTTGRMLALTGTRLRGRTVSGLGLASHFCSAALLPKLRAELICCPLSEVPNILDHFTHLSGGKGEEEAQERVKRWEKVYKAGDLEGTIARAQELAPEQGRLLAAASPLSLLVTERLQREVEGLGYREALLRSYKVAGNLYFCPEMIRGIEAALLSGGKASPRWNMATLGEVPAEMVDHCFNHDFKEGMLTMEQLLDMDTSNPY